jgi:DNA helicase-2/ATP-dependent DNA helicase PcrA
MSDIVTEILTKPYELTEEQKKVVLSKSRHIRVVAGAGAGKTETLTRRIAYLILVDRAEPSSIVAFTFTEKAAQAMKSRIYQRVGDLKGSVNRLGEMYIGTIHAYAKRLLEDHPKYGSYEVLDENQEMAFVMRHGWALGFGKKGYAEECRTFLRTVNMAWEEMLDEGELEESAPEFHHMMKEYEGILDEHKLLTFSFMIRQAVAELRKGDTMRREREVKYLFVDEYQDINRAQEEMIRHIGAKGSVFVVGDPRQSIYQWRGSDERFFESFAGTFSPCETFTISQNKRSVQSVVEAANTFADGFERKYSRMYAERGEAGLVGLKEHRTPEDEASWIADQIEALVKRTGIKYSDIAVLTRSVSTSAGPLINILRERRIPYIVGGTIGLFRRGEAQAMGRIFAWFSEEGFWVENIYSWWDQVKGDSLLTTALDGWREATRRTVPPGGVDELKRIKADLNSAKPGYRNVTHLYHDVLIAMGFKELDYRDANDAAVMANLGRFHNLLTDYEGMNRRGGRSVKWPRDLKGLCWFMNSYATQAYEEQPADDIRGVDAVRVMTVHQAKGLEWPAVFLLSTVERRLPSSMVGREQFWWDVPREMFDAERYEGNLEDERRLFYVAMTRARDVLVVSYFRQMGNYAVRRSEFVDVIEREGVPVTGITGGMPPVVVRPTPLNEEMQTFSAGELTRYNRCHHMYLLWKVWGYQPELTEALGYGNSLHYSLRRAGEMVAKGADPVDAIREAVETEFHLPYAGGEVHRKFKESAKEKLVRFAELHGQDLVRIEETEYRIEYPVENATVTGKVDVILRDGGVREVREYKTSQEVTTPEELAEQVRIYVMGLNEAGRPAGRASAAYLDEGEVKPVGIGGAELSQARDIVDRTVERIIERDFTPTPGESSCSRCDHTGICRFASGR